VYSFPPYFSFCFAGLRPNEGYGGIRRGKENEPLLAFLFFFFRKKKSEATAEHTQARYMI